MNPGIDCPKCHQDIGMGLIATTNRYKYACDRCNIRFDEGGRTPEEVELMEDGWLWREHKKREKERSSHA